jgi:hypothetical protein
MALSTSFTIIDIESISVGVITLETAPGVMKFTADASGANGALGSAGSLPFRE